MHIAVRIHSEPTSLCILHFDLSCLCNLLTRLYVVVCSMLVQKPFVNLCGCHVLLAKSTSLCASLLVCLLEVHIFPLVYFCRMHVQNSAVSFCTFHCAGAEISCEHCAFVFIWCLWDIMMWVVYAYCAFADIWCELRLCIVPAQTINSNCVRVLCLW